MPRGYKKARNGNVYFYGGAYNDKIGLRAWETKAEAIKASAGLINELLAKQKDFANLGVEDMWVEEIKQEKKELAYARREREN